MAIGSLPPVINEIQANSGQPGKTLAQQTAANSLLDLQAAATAEPAVAIVPETTLIEQAVAEALGRQGGLAPLYATLAELAEAPDLPDALKAAVDTVLALRLGDSEVTPERVAQAIRASGLFHEAVAAGKMAAALPPILRQALGGPAPDQRQQATTRFAQATSPLSTSVPATRPGSSIPSAPSAPASASSNAAMPASTLQTYGRQGALPGSVATQGTSQAVSNSGDGAVAAPGGPNAVAVAGPTAGASAPTPDATTPATGSSALPAGVAAAPADTAAPPVSVAVPSASSVAAGEPLLAVPTTSGPSAVSPPTAERISNTSALNPVQVPLAGIAEASPTPPTTGAPIGPLPLPPVSPAAPDSEGQRVPGPPVPAPSGGTPPSASAPTAASDASEGRASALQVPTTSPGQTTAASSRAFAPWTLGRPLTVPEASPGTSAASSPTSIHPAATETIIPVGSEAISARPASDRAPFVPSAVENLPTAPSAPNTPRTTAGPAASPLASGASLQQLSPGAFPSSPASGVQSGVPSTQAPAQAGQQTAPQNQIRSATPVGSDIAAPTTRQPSVQSSLAAPAATGIDLKGAIELLRRELVTWLGRNADVMASLDGDGNEAPVSRADRPSPPRKNGSVRGQPAMPLLGGDDLEQASTETLAGRALGEAERSLSRVFLHQAASAESRDVKASQTTQAFIFEIPIAGPNGTSIAQLRIERDDHAPTEPSAPPRRVFQVDIAFDIVPLGPVSVRVGLMDGRRVAVGVWCESEDGLVRMEAERENIVLGLEQEGMVVAGVDLHRGHPPEGRDETAVAASHRLDLQL